MVSLSQLQEVHSESMILLVGSPGVGKSTFCHQAVLKNLAMDRPIVYVTTRYGPPKVEGALRERGLGEVEPRLLNFVDAYDETVGVPVSDRPDTVSADCNNLSSIDVAISRLSEQIGRKGILLIFDSLTSPYLFNGSEILRFMGTTLSKFTAEGNAVLASIDEGCGKSEDLVAMMSLCSGVIKIDIEGDRRILSVVKHPSIVPTRIEVPIAEVWDKGVWEQEIARSLSEMLQGRGSGAIRREVENYVNVFWPNFAFWSGMLWDPRRFPVITYELNKKHGAWIRESISLFPWHMRLFWRFLPRNFSEVKEMKKLSALGESLKQQGSCMVEYLEDASKTDEHYFRVFESYECSGFENIGASMASFLPPMFAGVCQGLESWKGLERDWNAIETRCVGLGDPYCEFELVRGEIDELTAHLEKDISVVEGIHDRLMDRLMGFLLHGKDLVERPELGSNIRIAEVSCRPCHVYSRYPVMFIPAVCGERYRMAWGMGGARAGKKVGEHLMEAGIEGDEAVKRVVGFLEHCRVGKVLMNETIRVKENCESLWTRYYSAKWEEPCCFFTTGFLNGFFSTVEKQHVKETKCIGMGDPYCEWQFR